MAKFCASNILVILTVFAVLSTLQQEVEAIPFARRGVPMSSASLRARRHARSGNYSTPPCSTPRPSRG
uniref:Secreted peptide n=1 Tax=Rhipicephalus pulchellus TaxID=72859 RepID=L7LYK9_RHIPC